MCSKKNILFVVLAIFLSVIPAYGRDYYVGAGDVLKITVYDHDDLTTKVRVNSVGDIVIPLIGNVGVASLTVPGISQKITELLADGYIVNPQVNVFIEEYRSKKSWSIPMW